MLGRVFLGSIFVLTWSAPAVAGTPPLAFERIATNLAFPTGIAYAPGDESRLFVYTKGNSNGVAPIHVIDLAANPPVRLPVPFLTLSVATTVEEGTLGMVFHPDYANNGLFYVNYTVPGGGFTEVMEYHVSAGNPNVADPNSGRLVIRLPQPNHTHNGGWIAFGPDGYFYLAKGDGGPGLDPQNRAQQIVNQLLGKILRIDLNGDDYPENPDRNYSIPPTNPFVGTIGDDEIWAYGLRNPWRCTFDRDTGDLYIADVGQAVMEELNFERAGSPGGRNYGWRCWEGTSSTGLLPCPPEATMTFPVFEYPRVPGEFCAAIIGGHVYRGKDICGLQGAYFFSDYCLIDFWSLRVDRDTGEVSDFIDWTSQLDPIGTHNIGRVTAVGEDAAGELYVLDVVPGALYKLVPAGPCSAIGDMNCDGVISVSDIGGFVLALTDPAGYAAQFPACDINNADTNGDTFLTVSDIGPFISLIVGK